MDPLCNYISSISPSTDLHVPFSSAQAQQLLQTTGWTYYTIWKTDSVSNAPGLVWSEGGVNRSLPADQHNLYTTPSMQMATPGNLADSQQTSIKACKMGYLLQQFYRSCIFLPLGLGIAGVAMASGRYQWVNSEEELLKQISSLSTYNRQCAPSDLQEPFFETVVCLPFRNGSGVLEMGTKAVVPESDGMLQMLRSIDGLATSIHDKGQEKILSSAILIKGTGLSPCKAVEPQEHNYTLKVMQMYGGRAAIREPSISSSYYSSSSAAASSGSPPSADHQKGSSSNISASPTITVNPSHIPSMLIGEAALNELDILNQFGHIGVHSGSSPSYVPVPDFRKQQLNAQADQHGASQYASYDHFYSTNPALDCSTTNVAVSLHSGTDQQQQHGDKNKMVESSRTGESTQGASTEFQNRLSSTSTADPAAGNSSRACSDKRIEEQASAASRLEAESSSSYINKGYNVGILNTAGGFNVAWAHSKKPFEDEGGHEMVGLTSKAISKPAAAAGSREYAGSLAKDDQYTVQQARPAKDQYKNMQLGAAKDHFMQSDSTDHYVNMQKGAYSADLNNIKLQHYAGPARYSAAGMASRYGAFRRWNRSLQVAVSYQRKQKHAARDSFLKKILIHYLPKQQRESMVWIGPAIRRGSPGPLMGYSVQNKRGFLQAEAEAQAASESTQNEVAAAESHKYAERNRRAKQAECYEALRSLVPNLPKKDKVTLLQSSIQYIRELKDRVCVLDQEKIDTLIYRDNDGNKDAMRNSSLHTRSQTISSCLCLPPSIFKDGNYFQLNVTKIIKYEDTNMTNIQILSALQKKNLHCIKFRSDFEKSTSKFDVDILAQYKEGDNHTLSLNEKQQIEDWWPTFMKNLQINNP